MDSQTLSVETVHTTTVMIMNQFVNVFQCDGGRRAPDEWPVCVLLLLGFKPRSVFALNKRAFMVCLAT